MPQPTQPALSEQGEHAWKVGSGQNLGVGHSVLPRYAKDTVDASQVERIFHTPKLLQLSDEKGDDIIYTK